MTDGAETIVVRDARRTDWRDVRRLLSDARLPVADLAPDRLQHCLIAERCGQAKNETLGVIGLQPFQHIGLLRSLVVNPNYRKSGLGRRLVSALEAMAACAGVTDLWLLTIDAERYFEALGYETMSRYSAPDPIRRSEEFTSLCPDGASLMRKTLT